MNNRILILLFVSLVFGSACNNDDDANDVVLSGYDRIVDKNFRLVDAEVRANGIILQNRSVVFDCEKDNVTRYESSGTASTRYGTFTLRPK